MANGHEDRPADAIVGSQPGQDAPTTIFCGDRVSHGPCPSLLDRRFVPWVGKEASSGQQVNQDWNEARPTRSLG